MKGGVRSRPPGAGTLTGEEEKAPEQGGAGLCVPQAPAASGAPAGLWQEVALGGSPFNKGINARPAFLHPSPPTPSGSHSHTYPAHECAHMHAHAMHMSLWTTVQVYADMHAHTLVLTRQHMVRCFTAQPCQSGAIRVGSFPSSNAAEYKLQLTAVPKQHLARISAFSASGESCLGAGVVQSCSK